MANPIIYTQQYRPITLRETADADPLSVRHYRDAARNANVLKLYVTPWQLHDFPNIGSKTIGTVETYICQWGPLFVTSPFKTIRFEFRAKGEALTTEIVRVYAYSKPYTGALQVTSSDWDGTQQVSANITIAASASYAFYNGTVSLGGMVSTWQYLWLIVTGDGQAAEDDLSLMTFDAWPEPEEP